MLVTICVGIVAKELRDSQSQLTHVDLPFVLHAPLAATIRSTPLGYVDLVTVGIENLAAHIIHRRHRTCGCSSCLRR